MSIPDPTLTEPSPAQIVDCVRRVIGSSDESDCLQAATQLTEWGVRTRRSILPRGSPDEPAANRLPDPSRLPALIERFKAEQGETRLQLVSALGEWGDGDAAVAINEFLRESKDPPTQRACIAALMTIGGEEAMSGLWWAVEQVPLRRAALWALDELETGGTIDYSEGTKVGRKQANVKDPQPLGDLVPATTEQPDFAEWQSASAQTVPVFRLPEVAEESTSLSLLDRLRDYSSSPEAWNSLDSIYGALLRRWVVRLQDADAEDLVQTVLVDLRTLLPTFQHNGRAGAFRTWLRKILANRVREFQRSWWRRRTRPLVAELEAADNPLARLWDQEHDEFVARRVWDHLARSVTDRDAEVFKLAVSGEMKAEAIAAQFGTTPAVVWKIKSRILSRLRVELQGIVDLD